MNAFCNLYYHKSSHELNKIDKSYVKNPNPPPHLNNIPNENLVSTFCNKKCQTRFVVWREQREEIV